MAHTLRIGLTAGRIGGRARGSVGSWTSSVPAAPARPAARPPTVGAHRENNATLSYSVPSGVTAARSGA
ncbi:hypothetical protein [Streptomyces sp. YIM B13518]|uniref:hypothetical protein n=1 Tax=Streptomyces sp. YIM B13518 TaxID=3366316 RepID=UPI003692FF9C